MSIGQHAHARLATLGFFNIKDGDFRMAPLPAGPVGADAPALLPLGTDSASHANALGNQSALEAFQNAHFSEESWVEISSNGLFYLIDQCNQNHIQHTFEGGCETFNLLFDSGTVTLIRTSNNTFRAGRKAAAKMVSNGFLQEGDLTECYPEVYPPNGEESNPELNELSTGASASGINIIGVDTSSNGDDIYIEVKALLTSFPDVGIVTSPMIMAMTKTLNRSESTMKAKTLPPSSGLVAAHTKSGQALQQP